MTNQKNKKRRVRARSAKTGESYQSAHRAIDRAEDSRINTKANTAGDGQSTDLVNELPVIPLRNISVLPGRTVPLDVGRSKSVAVLEAVQEQSNAVIGMFTQRDPSSEDPGFSDLYPIGCAVRLLNARREAAGNYSILVQGLRRVRLEAVVETEPALRVKVAPVEDESTPVYDAPTNLDLTAPRADEDSDSTCKVRGWHMSGPQEYNYWADLTGESFEGTPIVRVWRSGAETYQGGSISQRFRAGPYRGKRLRFSAALRIAGAATALLSIRVDGSGGHPLAQAAGGHSGVSEEWSRHACVLDVPADATSVCIDIVMYDAMHEGCELFVADLNLEIVDASVPVTSHGLPAAPKNLTFSASVDHEAEPSNNCPIDSWGITGSDAGSYSAELAGETHEGKPIVRMWRSDDTEEGFGAMYQMFKANAYRGKRVRFSAALRAANVSDRVSLCIRVDGPDAYKFGEPLAFDNMFDRPRISGTADWSRHACVVDVPMQAVAIFISNILSGRGRLDWADVRFEIVPESVPVTDAWTKGG